MSRKYAIGIDLGTTNSAVGIWEQDKVKLITNKEGTRLTPSYAYYRSDEQYIGRKAMTKFSTDPQNVFFDSKRLLAQTIDSDTAQDFLRTWSFKVDVPSGTESDKAHFVSIDKEKRTFIPPEKVSSDILKSLLDDACRHLEAEPNEIEAVITVPAYFNINQKMATMKAAEEAGLNVRQLLSEPVAAALAYQLELRGDNRLKKGESVFIFDLGGGTFDVTIMRIEEDGTYKVIALGGDTHLGGRDFDRVVADIMEERLRKQLGELKVQELMAQPRYRHKLMETAHEVKESFTQTQMEYLVLSDIYPDAEDEELTRKEFEARSEELQKKIEKCCNDTLNDAKKEHNIDASNINHVLLVGGASKMNMVMKILKEIFPEGTNLSKAVSGDEAIAIGATVYATKLLGVSKSEFIKSVDIQDALPLSIGIEEKKSFRPILKRNSLLPVDESTEYSAIVNNQSTNIPIYEGVSEKVESDTLIGTIRISNLPQGVSQEIKLELNIRIDASGVLQTTAKIKDKDVPVEAKFINNFKPEFTTPEENKSSP